MKKIYDIQKINHYITKSKYASILLSLNVDYTLITYEKGEFASSPYEDEPLFQIVVQGSVKIYYMRENGTCYSLSNASSDIFLGDMDIFHPTNKSIYAEAIEPLTCIAFSIEKHRETLLSNHMFLALICNSLSTKIEVITTTNAVPATLTDRVLTYMKYCCDHEILKGIEQAAFHLHCSARQLQRIMNQCEKDGLVIKMGKGTYKLR